MDSPVSSRHVSPNMNDPRRELSARGLVLGALITVVFTAANVYLGLKVGLTFASSIPAAVISMVVLRAFGGATILENNAVQTEASAAGALSSIIFVLPGLVMVGHWQGFPWFETAGICAAGGAMGVLFTIPLRRALVMESALPFPEGVAAAAVLRLGQDAAGAGAATLGRGAALAAGINVATGALALLADGASATLPVGGAVFRVATGFSPALLGAGYLMGFEAGVAILVGVVASWGIAVPVLTALGTRPIGLGAEAYALAIWSHQVRLIGAGTIAIAAVWTLLGLVPAIARGLAASAGAARRVGNAVLDPDRDLAWPSVALVFAGALLLMLAAFLAFAPSSPGLAIAAAVFATAIGFTVAAACGVMSGIVGASASPISGIAILAVVLASLLLLAAGDGPAAIPFALFATTAVIAIAAISNDNLQDLKTGLLVGATPARQQLALVAGCLAGAVVIPPVLDLLYHAYGFAGALPRPGMDPARALAAPQATLMTALATGILGGRLDWSMIAIGVGFGAVLIATDLGLARSGSFRLPVIASGLGLYLPPAVSVTLFIGASLSLIARRRRARLPVTVREMADRGGTLFASGLIVGESLAGVLVAAIIAGTGRSDALALAGPGFAPVATVLGLAAFAATALAFVRAASR